MILTAMILSWFGAADAQEWSSPKPYADPILNAGAVIVGGNTYGQISGGARVGLRTSFSEPPQWLSDTRLQGVATYGIPSNSLGGDVRLGSFIGPNTKLILTQHGPDVWYNGYGTTSSVDYHLPYSVGLDFKNMVVLKLGQGFNIIGEGTPGIPFNPVRQGGPLEPIEFTASGAISIRTGGFGLLVGYTRRWSVAGITEGIILGASL